MKKEIFFKAVYFFFFISSFSAALATPRQLTDVQVFDAYQLSSSSGKTSSVINSLVFMYRELSDCRQNEECRRLVWAWISANGQVYELPIAERYFLGDQIKQNGDDFSLASNNQWRLQPPQQMQKSVGFDLFLQNKGARGELLQITDSQPQARSLDFIRLSNANSNLSFGQIKSFLMSNSYHLSGFWDGFNTTVFQIPNCNSFVQRADPAWPFEPGLQTPGHQLYSGNNPNPP